MIKDGDMMKVAVVVDSHIFRTPDNKFWVKGITDNDFFKRYLNVFDQVRVVSRVKDISHDDAVKMLRVDSEEVEVFSLPYSRGMKEYIRNYFKTRKVLKQSVQDVPCAIFRVPSVIAFLVMGVFEKSGKPFSIEVVADPELAYAENKIAQKMYTEKLRKAALSANGASYVTEETLQKKYPSRALVNKDSDAFQSSYSSIDLGHEYFGEAKTYEIEQVSFTICHTANKNATTEKGQDTLIKALGIVAGKGYDVRVKFIGDSEIRSEFERMADEAGVLDRISFTGLLSKKAEVRENLMQSDLFVYPTRAEGLPRSMIEAMAVGLPVISTPIGGIPELIDQEYIVPVEDYKALADEIIRLLNNKEEMNEVSRKNLKKARSYERSVLQKRRDQFYSELRLLAEKKYRNLKSG